MNYLVNEYFQSLQGEGYFTGTPAFFLRMQGCDVGCNFCDTKYTWSFKTKQVDHTNLKPNSPQHALMSIDEILEMCGETRHVVITGGEPCLQNLDPLCKFLIETGKTVQIETSGTAESEIPLTTWVTLSPKFNNPGKKPLLNTMLRKASEFKFPVKTKDDVKIIDKFLAEHNLNPRFIWLQPISQNSESTHICIDEARKRGWRVSVQTHKFLGLR